MKRIFFYSFFLIFCSVSEINAQKALLATGSNAAGGNGSVSYSVGQIDFTTKGNQIMEGVQQAYEITTLSTTETAGSDKKDILLYPNPFKDFLFVDFTTNDHRNSEFQLFDSSGKLLKEDKIKESKSEFNFSALPSAMYIIRINQNGKNIKTFKIIKK
ncbi:T9SS type A sorting domain-containing protein [Chryseobacterium chendengshani]|uniref:T9SS type A sorting domain-containing protein n=1 Tax=Chryseobacterium sp. LJ668 TaxID=2864040 RepID=UPI001C68F6D1|nr:T9SS type A sorting domain-containing protein [Chryseobacterium sp. LJ668]MBW8522018.1 T9SS type A sorting domain-containing protein [Chryseobacterium sp. LJ668]QYK17671.1 T9SS type A sorting domain-containing protein [Chryseobacterium sp. LJ668]